MKLLVVTQVIDLDDQYLSFFHEWVAALATRFETIKVICLKEGRHKLPTNVRVHSLGKEDGRPLLAPFVYAVRFKLLAWQLRHDYDAVFVHMNQEYVLIAGPLWKFLKKPVYLWRNHYAGSMLTDIAAMFCANVFCTSMHSYTAKYKRTIIMPVGVNTDRFVPEATVPREPRSILFFARLAPSKRPDLFIEALGILLGRSISFIADVYGTPLPEYETYYRNLQVRAEALNLHDRVRFHPGVANEKAPVIFQSHDIFVNPAASGMFDKMIFEAAASGCLVLSSSDDFRRLTSDEFYFETAEQLAAKLEAVLSMPDAEQQKARVMLAELVQENTLPRLMDKLSEVLRLA